MTTASPLQPSQPRVRFVRVRLGAFRNIRELSFEPAAKLNLIFGDNGQGKTSLLEALYFVATTKSFRTERLTTLIQESASSAVVRVDVEEGGYVREQRGTILAQGGRRMTLDGKRPERLVEYAQRTPIVAFHPGDLELVSGSASARRRLLDRIALFVDPVGFEHRAPFERAVRERQRVLSERGERASELDAFESVIGSHGARYQAARVAAARALLTALKPAFEGLGPSALELSAEYAQGGSVLVEDFVRELQARRARDRMRRSPSYGPTRDELVLGLAGRSARAHSSQGQQRLLTLALKLAELECIRAARGVLPVLLLDDVSSELDSGRTYAVYEELALRAGQVFVTTTRPELFPTPRKESGGGDWTERVDYHIREGILERVEGP